MAKKLNERRKVDFGEPDSEFKEALKFLNIAKEQKALRDEDEGVPISVLREAYSSVDPKEIGNAVSREINRRLLVLMDHYGIEREPLTGLAALGAQVGALSEQPNYFMLAVRMAEEFHGLYDFLHKGRGAPKKSFSKKKEFVLEVEAIMEEKEIGVSAACEILRKRPGKWREKSRVELERQYYRESSHVIDKFRGDNELLRIFVERLEEKRRKMEAEITAAQPPTDENR